MILIKISALYINSQSRPFHPPCHSSLFFSGSFSVHNGDHLRSGIICGPIWGSFAVLVSFAVQFGDHLRFWGHLRSWDHLRTRTVPNISTRISANAGCYSDLCDCCVVTTLAVVRIVFCQNVTDLLLKINWDIVLFSSPVADVILYAQQIEQDSYKGVSVECANS